MQLSKIFSVKHILFYCASCLEMPCRPCRENCLRFE